MDNVLMDMIKFIESNNVIDGLYISWICKTGWCYILHDQYLKHTTKYSKIRKTMNKMNSFVNTCYFQIIDGKVII